MGAKPKVYLAGPISGCNDEQRHAWRNDTKRGFADEFTFIDPTDHLVSRDGSHHAVVVADAEAIRTSDAVLANMWRESIGTSFGILHAHLAGKIVAVADPNLINSRMAAFYADAVERSLPAALNAIRTFLRLERTTIKIKKRLGTVEEFDREKLLTSVRKACMDAHAGDIVPARAIVSKTVELLGKDGPDERVIETSSLIELVWEAVAELEADPLHDADYTKIRRAWEEHDRKQEVQRRINDTLRPKVHDFPLEVRARSVGTHSTIWGKSKIGSDAYEIFQEIKKVEGITEIVFGPFQNTHSPPVKPHVRLFASKTIGVIEGHCFDKGEKGTKQSFQIRVANPDVRDQTLEVLKEHLIAKGHIRAVIFASDAEIA